MKGKVLGSVLAGVLAVSGLGFTGGAAAYPTLGVCQWDAVTDTVDCTYSNPDGIKRIFISQETDAGIAVLVNEVYDCETPVSISYTNVGEPHLYEVEACPPQPGVGGDDGTPDGFGVLPTPPEPPVIIDGFKQVEPGRMPDGETIVIGGLMSDGSSFGIKALQNLKLR